MPSEDQDTQKIKEFSISFKMYYGWCLDNKELTIHKYSTVVMNVGTGLRFQSSYKNCFQLKQLNTAKFSHLIIESVPCSTLDSLLEYQKAH